MSLPAGQAEINRLFQGIGGQPSLIEQGEGCGDRSGSEVNGGVMGFRLPKMEKMKIAVPLFKERVSPHFGSSSLIMLLEVRGHKIEKEAVWDVGGESPMEIARRLVNLDVKKLICGGIQSDYKEWLITKGVEVIDNQKGQVKEIVQRLLANLRRGGVDHGQ